MKPSTRKRLSVALLVALPAVLAVWWTAEESQRQGNLRFAVVEPSTSFPFSDGFESPGSGGGDPPVDFCDDPLVEPEGFVTMQRTWAQTFSAPDGDPVGIYPRGVSFPTPVGAGIRVPEVVWFVPNPGQTVNMYWDQVQARPQDGYGRGKPGDMWFAISPCHQIVNSGVYGLADLRIPIGGGLPTDDPFLRPGCRKFETTASLLWSTDPSVTESTDAVCKLEAGKMYFLTIWPGNPVTMEESCYVEGATECDVGVFLSASDSPATTKRWIEAVSEDGYVKEMDSKNVK